MEIVDIKSFEDYKGVVSRFNEGEKILIETANAVKDEILTYQKCKDEKIIAFFTDGCIELYYKEHSENLIICKVNILDATVKGYRMDSKVANYYCDVLKEKMKTIEVQEKMVKCERDLKSKFKWFIKKSTFEILDELIEQLKISKQYIVIYTEYFGNREKEMCEITHDIWELLKNSEKLSYLKFSKEFENLELTTE